jgi:hypothetical protein
MNTNKTQSLNLKYLVALAVVAVLSISAASFTALPAHAAGITSVTGSSTISGTVFNDANHNKVQDNGEGGLAGLMVWLHLGGHGNSGVVATTTTDSFGHYVFSNLANGTYFVTQKVKGFFHFGHKAQQVQKVTLTASTTAATVNFAEASSTKKHFDNDNDEHRIASSTKMLNIKTNLKAFFDDHGNHKGEGKDN